MTQAFDAQAGRCWACGYLLRGVELARCPECGRPFDRGDRATMNFGRPMGRVGRWALGPLGWALPGLMLLGAALVWATVRWPVEGWRFAWVDVGYYGQSWAWRGRRPPASGVDMTCIAGLALVELAAALWVLRAAARALAVARYRPPAFQRGPFWRRTVTMLAIAGAAAAGMGVGWPFRVGQRGALEHETAASGAVVNRPGFAQGWIGSAPAYAQTAARAALKYGSPRQRMAALKMLVETWDIYSLAALRQAVRAERDPDVRAAELRLLGLARDVGSGALAMEILRGSAAAPAERAAAADLLGLLHLPNRTFREGGNQGWTLRTDPPVRFDRMVSARQLPAIAAGEFGDVGPTPAGARDALKRAMLTGGTADERGAAARALVEWPPPRYALRYAEWGVFRAGGDGRLAFAKAQLDEVPPFVHRVGNPVSEMEGRIEQTMMDVLKPVIHLTADVPMAIDLEVFIRDGRPWVVYPRIDDLGMMSRAGDESSPGAAALSPGVARRAPRQLDGPDPPALAPLTDLREGYPWMSPAHRTYTGAGFQQYYGFGGGARMRTADLIGGIGPRWQSLIVSPTKLAWMQPAAVGADPRFKWWTRLRDVDCSWVSNRGESERFLYYDGPSDRAAPVAVTLRGGRVMVAAERGRAGAAARRGCYVHVTPAGVAAHWVDDVNAAAALDVSATLPLPRARAEGDFLTALRARGLTAAEAAGLVDCWRPAFFERPGRRFITFMTDDDYATQCPMTIRPRPTTTVRVGLLWTSSPKSDV